jgi:acyl carrier protein
MTIASLKIESNATARQEILAAKDVRTLNAQQLGVDVKIVTDEAHFADDLGADWLDRLGLIIEIEAQFPTVEFTDDDETHEALSEMHKSFWRRLDKVRSGP